MTTRPRRRIAPVSAIAALLLAVAVATACGGASESDNRAAAPASGAPPDSSTDAKPDACSIVTQEDATALFEQPAERQQGQGLAMPMMIGECLWTWDTETSNQLLQFRIWSTELAYSQSDDEFTEAFDLADRGHVRAHPQGGVDVSWVQGGRMIGLSYSKVGPAVPSPLTKTDAMKALARKVSGKL